MAENKWIRTSDFMEDLFFDVDTESSEYVFYDTLGSISIELVNYRAQHNMTQKDLASFLGVSQAMISKYESGDYNFSLRSLIDLFSKLSIPFNFSIGMNESGSESDYLENEYSFENVSDNSFEDCTAFASAA